MISYNILYAAAASHRAPTYQEGLRETQTGGPQDWISGRPIGNAVFESSDSP
jgi:hypothetical protein